MRKLLGQLFCPHRPDFRRLVDILSNVEAKGGTVDRFIWECDLCAKRFYEDEFIPNTLQFKEITRLGVVSYLKNEKAITNKGKNSNMFDTKAIQQ